MKRILALLLATIMLLCSCGTPSVDGTDPIVTDAPDTEPNVTETPETDAPVTNAPDTEPPIKEIPSDKVDFTIPVIADAYVINADSKGDQSSANFGTDKEIHLKTTGGSLTRYGYLKFDISALKGDNDFTCIDLDLTLTTRQNDAGNPEFATVEVYGCDATGWDENSITFNTQPTVYSLITSQSKISTAKVTTAFSITDYVRNALAAGQTEIALYLKEATTGTALHTRFASKENGDAEKAPKLSVYYGTKVDDSKYEEDGLSQGYEVSKGGVDTLIGVTEIRNIYVSEDTYVEGGENTYNNFGSSTMIDFKAQSGTTTNLYRIPLFKFDISLLERNSFNKAIFNIKCTVMQDTDKPTLVDIYACDPYAWDEKTVTFNTRPEPEEYITSVDVEARGIISFDVTEYVKKAVDNGDKMISFYLDGDISEPLRLNFESKETENGYSPMLKVSNGDLNFSTYIEYTEENPWDVAAEAVSDWLNRWEIIKQGGDTNVETIVKDDSEYSLTVDAASASKTNGYDTQYTSYPTRNVSTLNGYSASTGETSLYDEYGGYMGGDRYEATGFFYTTKIGDRWWTIDPLGYPFYRVACVLITNGSSTKQKASVLAKYGSTSAWAEATTDRLHELGYNSAGGWSDISNLSNADEPLSQTQIFYALKNYAKKQGLDITTSGNTALLGSVLPVFDPAFATHADATVEASVSKYASSPYVYGWMSDNELPDSNKMLDNSLAFDPADARFIYSYATAWTFMYLKTGKADVSLADVTDELRLEYRAMVYDKYFNVISKALERYAPNHQYMGCRFLSGCYKDEYVLRVAGYYCDVITLNYYGAWEGDATLIANIQEWSGRPFVVTEWYAKGMDVWEKDNRMTNQSGAGFTVRTQSDRGLFYQNYALQLLECKGCVGFDWFQYWDNDPDNLSADTSNRNANKGIVDNDGNEYTELTKYMDELNNQKYTLIDFFDAR